MDQNTTADSHASAAPDGDLGVPYVSILDETGCLAAEPPQIKDEKLQEMLRLMLLGRLIDQKAVALQRRGKLGTYPPLGGQEASAVGTGYAMDPEVDHFVPQYREQLTMMCWGLTLSRYLLQRTGHPDGFTLPEHGRLWPQQVALAAHLPHAVGLSWGLRLQGKHDVVLAQFGDGASNEGDFHEALNIAGVRKSSVVFVCQNNGFAISIPWEQQSAAKSVASRAAGYGFPGIAVDGNDVLAVYSATAKARERALAGLGPTLIEARTTRLGAHTTADDPTRYVPDEYMDSARRRDPIVRFRTWLTELGQWSPEHEADAMEWCNAEIQRGIDEFDATPKPVTDRFFDHLFEQPDERLRRQRAEFTSTQEK